MTDERKIRVMRSALNAILLEAKEPIIRVYAQSALDECIESTSPPKQNAHCRQHNWYGNPDEKCPICEKNKPSEP